MKITYTTDNNMKKKVIYYLVLIAVTAVILVIANKYCDYYKTRVLSLAAINIILAVGLNIIFGFTGQLSLGHAGFMAIGAYVATLATLSPQQKAANFFLTPIAPFLENFHLPFIAAVLLGGFIAGIFAIIIGTPVLRLGDDYLAMATMGFAEIIRVLANNLVPITNGALGIKGLPSKASLFSTWIWALFAVVLCLRLVRSSYGRALKAIKNNEIAAEAVGINLLFHKVMSFAIGGFLAGIGGALLAFWSSTVDPKMFMTVQSFQVLTIVVAGGLGSVSGSVVMAIIITVLMEFLRFIEGPMNLGFIKVTGVPGMRMLLYSIMLLIIILKFSRGLFGEKELSDYIPWLHKKSGKTGERA